jgi:hypothetical protein
MALNVNEIRKYCDFRTGYGSEMGNIKEVSFKKVYKD